MTERIELIHSRNEGYPPLEGPHYLLGHLVGGEGGRGHQQYKGVAALYGPGYLDEVGGAGKDVPLEKPGGLASLLQPLRYLQHEGLVCDDVAYEDIAHMHPIWISSLLQALSKIVTHAGNGFTSKTLMAGNPFTPKPSTTIMITLKEKGT
jgi:hypothetical protein